jgi:hypothetical protein
LPAKLRNDPSNHREAEAKITSGLGWCILVLAFDLFKGPEHLFQLILGDTNTAIEAVSLVLRCE